MTTATYTKSEIMSWYNRARAAARKGKKNMDEARTNRALGCLMSGHAQEHWTQYHTTTYACACPDRHFHPNVPCKGMVAKMIATRIDETHDENKPTRTIRAWLSTYQPHVVFNCWTDYEVAEFIAGDVYVQTMNGTFDPIDNPAETIARWIDEGWEYVSHERIVYETRHGWRGLYQIVLRKIS